MQMRQNVNNVTTDKSGSSLYYFQFLQISINLKLFPNTSLKNFSFTLKINID